jgi:hypothetical protein
MTGRTDRQLVGRWRITEADLWERDFLDLIGPATMTINADGHGEIAFGAVQAGLDIDYAPSMVFFTWFGFDEMDEVAGTGSAELLEDGSLEIEFAYHLGDEAVFKALRESSSSACSHDHCQPLLSWRFLRRRRTQGDVDAQGRGRN